MANSVDPDQLASSCNGRVYPGSAGQGLVYLGSVGQGLSHYTLTFLPLLLNLI